MNPPKQASGKKMKKAQPTKEETVLEEKKKLHDFIDKIITEEKHIDGCVVFMLIHSKKKFDSVQAWWALPTWHDYIMLKSFILEYLQYIKTWMLDQYQQREMENAMRVHDAETGFREAYR